MNRKEAHQNYKKLSDSCKAPEERNALARNLCLKDLFFLLVYVLGREDCDRDWVYDRIREVEEAPDFHLDLWAREHYKSSVITFAKTIQDILSDPEVTFGIFSHTRPIAKGFLRQIKREFEGNKALVNLFPDVLWDNPQKEAPKWSEDDGIIVKRTSNPKESTVEAWGLVDGQPTSKHFKVLLYDDVVTKESVSSPDMIGKVNASWELSLSLGVEGGRRRYVGTRYHYNDTYRLIMDRGAATPRIHPATIDGTVNGKPVLMHPDTLAQKRREQGAYTFACQLLLDPKADETQGFKESWLKFWPCNYFHNFNKIILCDPANEKKKSNDYTVFMVIGLGEDENYYILDMIRDRLSLTERSNVLFALHRGCRPQFVGYEKYGKDTDIEHYQERMNRDNYRFDITPLGGPMSKGDRIRTLIPLFESGRIFLPDRLIKTNYEKITEDLTQTFLREEYNAFPVAAHDDMLDCLARITDPDCYKEFPIKGAFSAKPVQDVAYDPFGYAYQQTNYNVFGGR
jgi:predicted phage terminase large subunit-like protein